ncbi:MAG: thioredoxin family protein [Candidatus Dormibacteraceae bacterium]
MKITIQYFDGCPHWKLAEERVLNVVKGFSNEQITLERQLIDSPATAERVGFHGSPTILVDGQDLFATGAESISLGCRVFLTEDGIQGAPSEKQLRDVIRLSRQD